MPQVVMTRETADALGLTPTETEVTVTLQPSQEFDLTGYKVFADVDGDLAIRYSQGYTIYLSKRYALQLRDLITAMNEAGLLS